GSVACSRSVADTLGNRHVGTGQAVSPRIEEALAVRIEARRGRPRSPRAGPRARGVREVGYHDSPERGIMIDCRGCCTRFYAAQKAVSAWPRPETPGCA